MTIDNGASFYRRCHRGEICLFVVSQARSRTEEALSVMYFVISATSRGLVMSERCSGRLDVVVIPATRHYLFFWLSNYHSACHYRCICITAVTTRPIFLRTGTSTNLMYSESCITHHPFDRQPKLPFPFVA